MLFISQQGVGRIICLLTHKYSYPLLLGPFFSGYECGFVISTFVVPQQKMAAAASPLSLPVDTLKETLRALAKRAPAAFLRLAEIAFSPRAFLAKLVLVSLLQLLASVIKRGSRFRWHMLGLSRPSSQLQRCKTLGEWEAAKAGMASRKPE